MLIVLQFRKLYLIMVTVSKTLSEPTLPIEWASRSDQRKRRLVGRQSCFFSERGWLLHYTFEQVEVACSTKIQNWISHYMFKYNMACEVSSVVWVKAKWNKLLILTYRAERFLYVEICSCCSFIVLLGPAWALLTNDLLRVWISSSCISWFLCCACASYSYGDWPSALLDAFSRRPCCWLVGGLVCESIEKVWVRC